MCDKYGIQLIVDEVMSGFGRTGKWFAIEHYDIVPDIMVMAKGITSGYLPLGAVITTDTIARHFDDHILMAGLTYSAHAMSCAAAIACITVIRDDQLVENACMMGNKLEEKLTALQHQHPSIGEYRGIGLFYVLELVKNRDTREPISEWNQPLSKPMADVDAFLKSNGLMTFTRWNMVFIVPPLIITENQLDEGLEIISRALEITDAAMD